MWWPGYVMTHKRSNTPSFKHFLKTWNVQLKWWLVVCLSWKKYYKNVLFSVFFSKSVTRIFRAHFCKKWGWTYSGPTVLSCVDTLRNEPRYSAVLWRWYNPRGWQNGPHRYTFYTRTSENFGILEVTGLKNTISTQAGFVRCDAPALFHALVRAVSRAALVRRWGMAAIHI